MGELQANVAHRLCFSLGSVLTKQLLNLHLVIMSNSFPEIKSKHSLVAKHVTEPVWAKLGNAKTETSG